MPTSGRSQVGPENKLLAALSARCYKRLFPALEAIELPLGKILYSPIVKRLARWLLLMQNRMESDVMQLTHEFISTMLGTRRAGVTIAAGKLQAAGIITYHRGKSQF